MESTDLTRVVYLVLLGTVLVAYMLVANRNRLGTLLRTAMLWGIIFVGAVAAVGLWTDIRDDTVRREASFSPDGRIEVRRAPDGHFYLDLGIDGATVSFVVDTGAGDMVLSQADAKAAGLDPGALRYTGLARTANGTVRTARVRLDEVRLGDHVDTRVPAFVNEGELDTSLLGMGYLRRFARIEIAGDRLILTR